MLDQVIYFVATCANTTPDREAASDKQTRYVYILLAFRPTRSVLLL
jgi:hypothetical protein